MMALHSNCFSLLMVGVAGLIVQQASATGHGTQGAPPTPPTFHPVPSAAIAQCRGLSEGRVKVQFLVDVSGHPQAIKILESPDEQHAICVTKMVKQSQFGPAMQDGKPFAANVTIFMDVKATPK